MTPRHLGIIQSVSSGVCYGALGLLGKTLYEHNVAPGQLLALRFLLASVMTLIFVTLKHPARLRLTRKQFLSCAILGVFGYALFSLCFFSALKGLSASLTVLLLFTFPVLVAIGGWLFFKEAVARQHLPAIPIASLGLIGLVWGDLSVERAEFLVLAMVSALVYALYILASSRWLKGVDPGASTAYIQAFAGLTLGTLYLQDGEQTMHIVQNNWLMLGVISFLCTVMAMGLFLAGLQKLKGWEVSVLSMSEPLTGVVLATTFLNESLTWVQLAGAGAVIIALVWVSWPVNRSIESETRPSLS